MPSGIVALVGRPNVGKSTLFNRLTGQRQAIVDELAGLTRDRLYGVTEWRGRRFTVIDTAGIDPSLIRDDPGLAVLAAGTQQQARLAIEEADVCVQLVDVRAGITALDQEVATILRRGGKPVILAGNKAESTRDPHYAHELYCLGLGEPTMISALVGTDTGDLLDRVVDDLPPAGNTNGAVIADELRLAIIGKPNVGKSSLLNALVGEERALVSPLAGTTRDTVDTIVRHRDRAVRLVDTAGIRRRGVIDTNVEHYSLLRAFRALERSDVALLVVDANEGVVAQDRHVAGYAVDAGKGLVVIANKWDLVDQERRADPSFLKSLQEAFDFIPGVPLLTVSALEGRNLRRVLDTAATVATARAVRIPTAALNTLLRDAFLAHPPRNDKGRQLKLLYATQASTPAPTIVLFVNDPDLLHFAYGRYLENRIRAVFGFAGTRMRMVARARADRER
ncbi:MAG: ribosome biogenesis GTPase Der [Candidatus Dormibacteraeota bacterium]|uniref:GTPase Der n=1 Tax=Candidatus Amunia macphersoniae TaxID=3127014 RepID=A0A934KNF0_9BACT|nr:ribosome biogenesis GTPase Der [Candidatus Dormibacteraeota bacterium]